MHSVRRFLPYFLALAFAAGSLFLYLHLAKKTLPPVEVLSVVPNTAVELFYFNDLGQVSAACIEQTGLSALSPGLAFFEGMDFSTASANHPWLVQSRAVAWRTADTDEFTLAWGFPGGWPQARCEQWCMEVLGAKPIRNGVFELSAGEATFTLTVVGQRASVGMDVPVFRTEESPRSRLVDLLSIGTKKGLVHVVAPEVEAEVLPWLGSKTMPPTVVRDVYFSNGRISGEEIVVFSAPLPRLSALPEEWMRWIPASVTAFQGIGLESGYAWVEFQQALRSSVGAAAAWNGALAELETEFATDADQALGAWWNGGLAEFSAFGRSYTLLGTVDGPSARRGLEQIGEDALPFLDGSFVQLTDDRFLQHLIGEPATGKSAAWVSSRTVILADNEAALLKLAARLAGEKSIDAKHILGKALAAGEQTVTYFQSGAEAVSPLAGFNVEALAGGPDTEATHTVYSGARAGVDRLVTRFEVSKAATVRPQTRYLWEYAVAGLRQETLAAIRNHTDNSWYTLVQDSAHVVHAISAKGEAMWTYDAGAPLLGSPEGVDLYKNGKIQGVFATTDAVHAVDLLGRKVEGFPIRVKSNSAITTPLFVADYDANRNYRLLFGTSDGALNNYTSDGKPTRGWNYKPRGAAPKHIAHLRAGTADYVFVAYLDGQVDLLKRNGEPRYATRLVLPNYKGEPVFRVTSEIARSSVLVTDSSGVVVEGVFGQADGRVNHMVGAPARATGGLLLADVDRDRSDDLFYTTDTSVVGVVGGVDFNRSFRSKLLPVLRAYAFSDGVRIGAVLPNAKEFYLLEADGTNADGFPVFAGGVAFIRDFSGRGGLDLVTTDGRAIVMAYRLE